jgi:UDP-N-acetylmuramoyl-tripeptide--D-alanyl-D-alanine ligase
MLRRLGLAIAAGKGLFLYGQPGNGKTSVAERITAVFGSSIWIPRAVSVWGEIVRLSSGVTIVDDSYNANPTATRRALDVLASAAATRRIAVIGEMLELGERSAALHQDVGRTAAGAGIDVLFAVGGAPARALADAAIAAGMPAANVHYFATSDEAAAAAAALVTAGDLILVKGSRGIKTDRVVDRLKAERG